MDLADLLQVLVGKGDGYKEKRVLMRSLRMTFQLTVLAQQSDHVLIVGPYHILDSCCREFGQYTTLLEIKQDDGSGGGHDQASGTSIKDFIDRDGGLERFGDSVGKVMDLDLLIDLIQDSKSVAGDEEGGVTSTTF
jgi:hypothetical protein